MSKPNRKDLLYIMKNLTERQKQAIQTKLKITEIATDLFKKKGFDSVKIQDICEAANISVGAFYHHFKSKSEIINTGHKQVDLLIHEKLQSREFTTSLSRISGLLEEASDILTALGWPFVGEVYKTLISSPSKYTLSEERFVYQEFKMDIADAIAKGELSPNVSADYLANIMMRTFRGVIFDWCLHEGKYLLKEQLLADFDLIIANYKSH